MPSPPLDMAVPQTPFEVVRTATESLCAPLAIDDYGAQSMPDASPAKWHLAHTSWFFEEFVLGEASPAFRYLFNSYYDAVGSRHERAQRGLITRPTIEEVMAYRKSVTARVAASIESGTLSQRQERILTLGLHHEQQHQELLLTDLKHLFSCNPLLPAYAETPRGAPRPAVPLEWLFFEGGLIEMGHAGAGFCFDNELARHRVYLEPFWLTGRPVTNGEFREFIRAGGYQKPTLWLADGWACVRSEGWERPLYWQKSLHEAFGFSGLREIDSNAAVTHVSYYEADAFARWAGARLPTEFEWEAAARRMAYGEVWEWTSSAYAPYPGFQPEAGALGEYNGKFMANQLVLRGGSSASPPGHIRPTYRNFFYPTARWQLSGLRLARDDRP